MGRTVECAKCIHFNVCELRIMLSGEKYKTFFGDIIDTYCKIASICEEYKESSDGLYQWRENK